MRLLSVLFLTLTWLLALARFTWQDAVTGVILSVALLRVYETWLFRGESGRGGSALAFPWFLVGVVRRFGVDTAHATRQLLRGRTPGGYVRLPIVDRTTRGVAVTAWVVTLTPGTVLVDVDEEAGEMVFHSLDADDPDRLRRQEEDFYERYQRRVFP